MKIGVTLSEGHGLDSEICIHFGQCSHFLLVDVENGQITGFTTVPNTGIHGEGCQAVEEILKYNITHMVAGGMGINARQKFAKAGVPIYGCNGKARHAVDALLANKLKQGIDACENHGGGGLPPGNR